MKKILLGILLPVLTLITLIGTGFATWYFNDDLSVSKGTTANVEVTAVAKIGTIEISKYPAILQLNQPRGSNSGINLVNAPGANTTNITFTYRPPVLGNGEVNIGRVRMEVKVVFENGQHNYLRMKSGWQSNYGMSYFKYIDFDGSTTNTFTIIGADFEYVTENVPQNSTDYQKMKTAFEKPIKIEVSARSLD